MKLGANLRYIKKQISKKFSKFARPLLIVLTLVGMISAVAFTNFSQETQTSADSWNTPSPVAGYIGANGVHLVKTIPDGRAFAFYNLWDDPQTRVAVHPNNTDYSLHSDFYLDTYSWVENHYDSVDVNNNGDIVIADYDAGDLLVYDVYYDGDTASLDGIDYYPIPEDPEGSGQVFARYDDSNNNIYVITNSQLVVYYSGDYANPDVYALDSIGTVSAELDETNDYLYITADDYFYRYDTGAFPSFQYYDLLNDNSGLHDYLQISPDGERVFIRSSNTSKVYEYDVTTWNPIIVQEYDLSGWESRFKVNDDFLYSYSWSKVARWSRSDPEDILDSGDVENVAIRNIDLVGDDVLALSFWYRELYLYDLEVEPEGDLGEEDCDFPYVWNDPKCERYVYSSSLHINTDEGEDVSIASTYNKQDNFYAVLNWNEGDYPAGSINVNGDIYELNYDTNDYMLSSYMVPAPGGVFISLVGLGDNAQILYFEYPSGNISLYPMPFFGTVGLSINDDGDLLMWEEYGYDYAVAPNDGGFPDFDNLFTSSATEPLSTKGGFIVNGGDVIFQMYSGDVIYAISAASGYTEEDFIDLSGVLGSIEITVKSKPGGYDLYVAGYTSDPTELHIKPYTGCELGAPFSSCTEENPIVMPYGAPIYGISSLLIDEDDNIFFAGSNIGEIGRVLQSNKAVEFFSLTDLDDSIISYDLDNNQNLYITSFNYIYELHQYDLLFESDGGGDPGGAELSETHIIGMSWSSNPSPDGAPALIAGEELLIDVEVYDPINPGSIPTGYVALRMDDVLTVLDILELDENGMVTFSIRPNPGFHFVHAYYLGDDTYDTSQSVNHTLRVYSIATFTTLETSQNPVVKGDSFTLTAHVELPNYTIPDDSPVEFSGYVRFAVGTIDLGWELVDLNGDVSITVNTSDNPVSNLNLNEGVHHIRAHYLPFWDGFNPWLRVSSSETLFQSVVESGEGGESSEGSDIPPEGGEGGASDFAASIKGRDKVTGSISETKIGSILEWVMDYNNLGPNSNAAVTYFPIRENQEFVVGSIQAPPNWIITYSQDQTCDESTFTYTPVGADGTTDSAMRCVRFQNDRVNVPPTRSDLRYITTAADFSELNVASLGGIDVYKVVPYNNKVFYFNHHWTVTRMEVNPTKTMFCFDLEINDTCVSQNPNIVYPLSLGLNGWADKDDEYISSKTSFEVNAEVVGDKMYIPMTDMNSPDPDENGHGFMCWDLSQDYYCNTPGFTRGAVSLNTTAFNAWGWGNIGDIEYNPDMQELYATSVGPNEGRMVILCFSLVTNTPCVGQPYDLGTFTGYDPGYGSVKYQASTGRIYSTSGGNVGNMDRQIQCLIASTKEICPDFPEGGVQILPNKRNQQIFYNANNDEICAMLYSDHEDFGPTSPRIYCYDLDAETFYDYLPNMDGTHFANEMFHDLSDQYPGRLYYMAKWDDAVIMCWDLETGEQCEGWEDGIASNVAPFDDRIYTFYYAFECMWAASDSGRVFTFDPITGGTCNPLITLTQGNVAVMLNGEGMFCDTDPEDVTWNKVKVVDTGVTPSPAILNATVYDSTQCTTNEDNIVSCTGSPLMSGNLLLNSGHELDISSISYEEHPSLTAILEFQYPAVPEPAPGFYIELNPTNKAQMCADTKLVFTGALCANPITTVCENTNISYIEDPVSNNNSGQYCLNVETYFGKDPNSALCFVATTPDEDVFTVFNPDAVVAPPGTVVPFDPSQTYNRGDGSYSFGNGFFGFIEGFIEESIPQIITEEVIRETLSSVDTSTPLAVTAVTAVTTATVVATSAVAAGSGVGQIFGIFLGFLTPKRKKYWGVIVDELTNKPIAFASITLSVKAIGTDNQMSSTVVAQAVSDLDGRYRLNTDRRDEFYLEVKASGYQPFTKFIKMANPLASEEDIVYDVPLRRLDAKPNIFKQLINYRKKNLIGFARGVLLVSSVLGFIFTIYSQINFPTKLNWVLLVIYILVFVISFYPTIYQRIQKRGKVVDMDANLPIPGAVVRIYDEKQQIALSLTNNKGEARFDLPSGEYSILASKRGYIMISEEGKNLIKAVVKREGYLDRNILMRATAEAPAQPAAQGVLENPFS